MPARKPSLEKLFSPATNAWRQAAFAGPTEVQEQGWPAIAAGDHTLMCAPTGSGKTLAAFLWCIDQLLNEPEPPALERCRVLYVSPLKALTVDVDRNLRAPLRGIALAAQDRELELPQLRVGIRSGDTPADERRKMQRQPPDILITTPESLYLLLTSAARQMLASVRWVIVDEIHTMTPSKRGAHLAVSMERLSRICRRDPQRIGLSATQRPLETAAKFLGGAGRDVTIIDAGKRCTMELAVEVGVDEMAAPASPGGEGQETLRRGMWPAIEPRLLELIKKHRSTIIFVNSRRRAERLAGELNELASEDLVRTHHGSISKEQRLQAEEALKAGRLPALVATSSLELGIDMGAVDLVVLVGSPQSVASGLQRVGRAGHTVGALSRGVLMPVHRGDLLETAAIVGGMLEAQVEKTKGPQTPLDILAQQIVAMAAMDEWEIDELQSVITRAQPFVNLGRRSLETVLDMLSGRYPSDDFAELRPRLVWDRSAGRIRARAGAQSLAVISGGTIPDRGLYTVHILDDGRRVGELDEEMVYELRPNQTFILGATTWRVAEITPSQVLVTPAPGEPGTLSFWHGDLVGRPVEVGAAMGRLTREIAGSERAAAERKLRDELCCDIRAARNLVNYIHDEKAATGYVPDDKTIVVESFRDQLGDWRVCVLSCWGARVHAPWALAVAGRLRQELACAVEEIHDDDGFALRFPDSDAPPGLDELLLDPEEVGQIVMEQLTGSALFASRFRENAARSLLLPRRRPGQRTPLWQQRQRSADLLGVAAAYPEFPVLAETVRECLADVFDMDALTDLMRRIRSREVRMVAVTTEKASPFATSLVFDYVAQYMYEGDAPLAERRAQALTLDAELLAELLGNEELSDLLDPEAIAATELELQFLEKERRPRDADQATDILRRIGDLTTAEVLARGITEAWLDELSATSRIVEIRLGGEMRWIAVEDAARYRDLLGVALPAGLPEAFTAEDGGELSGLLLRYASSHVPFLPRDVAERLGLPHKLIAGELDRLVEAGRLHLGHFIGDLGQRQYCHPNVLRLLRRRSLAKLRHEVEPTSPDALARFLPAWHGVGTAGTPELDIVAQLEGAAIPASVLERDVLPARISNYAPHMLDAMLSSGEVVWIGRGTLGKHDGRVAIYRREAVAALAGEPVDPPGAEVHDLIRAHLREKGASFFSDIRIATLDAGGNDPEFLLGAIWDLVWSGELTNDSFAPVRALLMGGRAVLGSRRRGRPGMAPALAGRWSLVENLRRDLAPEQTARLRAETLLARYGVLTREAVLGEQIAGGFVGLYPVLRAFEESGRARRGYFVEGLGGSQFALAGAADRLRTFRDGGGGVVALAATDPANPYGAVLPWPQAKVRLARVAGAYVVLDQGQPVLYLQRGGRALVTLGAVDPGHIEALMRLAGNGVKVEIREVDGEKIRSTALAAVLGEAGFSISPKGMVRYAR
jgi:ATP-dependent helicase Lhr and Lhr-like helicase